MRGLGVAFQNRAAICEVTLLLLLSAGKHRLATEPREPLTNDLLVGLAHRIIGSTAIRNLSQ